MYSYWVKYKYRNAVGNWIDSDMFAETDVHIKVKYLKEYYGDHEVIIESIVKL